MNFSNIIKKYSTLFKLPIVIAILVLIYHQLTSGYGYTSLKSISEGYNLTIQPAFLIACFCLMPLNWVLESIKFKKLMAPHLHVTSTTSMSSILVGVAAGIVTPGRIGEYAGRIMTTDPLYKTEVVSATLLSSIAQNLCNISGGVIFSYFFLKSSLNVTYDNTFAFVIGVILQLVILISIYYHLPKIAHWTEKKLPIGIIVKYSSKLKSLDLYNTRLLNQVLVLSSIRYMVYFLQYFFIIKFFNVEGPIFDIAGNISGIYMIQTGIPLPTFLSIMARGEVAVLVWSGMGVSSIIALSATFTLWLINLILPSIAGLAIFLFSDFNRNTT